MCLKMKGVKSIMSLFDELRALNVDVDEGLNRVMGDSSLYEMMLGMFLDSVNGNPVEPADFDADDVTKTIERVHMLKGVTGNLAMTRLFTEYTQILGLLRAGETKQAKESFERLLPLQEEIMNCIKRHANAQ